MAKAKTRKRKTSAAIRLCGVTPAPIPGGEYGDWDWSGKPTCMTFDGCGFQRGALELHKSCKRYTVDGTVVHEISPTGMPIAVLNVDIKTICGGK